MKILIGGDFFVEDEFQDKDLLGGDIIELFKSVDYRIVNLEGPITNSKNKIIKTGPHLKTKEETIIPFLTKLNIDLVTLSNNHIMDYGDEGIINSFISLNKNNIKYTGAGKNTHDAKRTFTLVKDDLTIGIINISENEWASSSDCSYGSNPLDIIKNTEQIIEAKNCHDYVICIIHGGHEYYNLPSPRMRDQYRFYADNGADLIVGHHTHCISGYELYNKVPIYYGIGNMLFTRRSLFSDWYKGILLEISIDIENLKVAIHPISQDNQSFFLTLSNSVEKTDIINRFSGYSDIITDDKSFFASWNSYVLQQSEEYLRILSPISFIKNKYVRGVLKMFGISLNNRKGNSLLLNMLRCEAHRDVSIEVMKNYIALLKRN